MSGGYFDNLEIQNDEEFLFSVGKSISRKYFTQELREIIDTYKAGNSIEEYIQIILSIFDNLDCSEKYEKEIQEIQTIIQSYSEIVLHAPKIVALIRSGVSFALKILADANITLEEIIEREEKMFATQVEDYFLVVLHRIFSTIFYQCTKTVVFQSSAFFSEESTTTVPLEFSDQERKKDDEGKKKFDEGVWDEFNAYVVICGDVFVEKEIESRKCIVM